VYSIGDLKYLKSEADKGRLVGGRITCILDRGVIRLEPEIVYSLFCTENNIKEDELVDFDEAKMRVIAYLKQRLDMVMDLEEPQEKDHVRI